MIPLSENTFGIRYMFNFPNFAFVFINKMKRFVDFQTAWGLHPKILGREVDRRDTWFINLFQ